MADFLGPNLSQPSAVPFPSVAEPARAPQFSALGEAINEGKKGREAAKKAKEESDIFAKVAEQQTEAVSNFLNDAAEVPEDSSDPLSVAENSLEAQARQNPVVRNTLGQISRIAQARSQARSPEDYERLYIRLADINKRIINDHPQYADVVLKASQAALGFDPLEKAIGLEQSERLKQLDFERAQRKTYIDRAVAAGTVDVRADGSFDEADAVRKGQALLQQDELLKKSKERADLLATQKPSEPELRRSKFSGYTTSALPVIKADIASFGANLIQNFAELENDPASSAKIQELWGQKRAAFLANQELKIAEIDDPTVQADARTFLQAQLKPYDDLYTGDYATLAKNKRRLDNLTTQANIDLHESAPMVARINQLGDPLAEAILAKQSASDPEFYNSLVNEVTNFASGNTSTPTAKQELDTFISVANGEVPLSSLTNAQARSVIKNATIGINALSNNPSAVDEKGLASYATLATQLAAVADARALPADQLARAVDTLSSPNKLRLFEMLAGSGAPPEQIAELASGLERVNQKNINAQAQLLKEKIIQPSSPQFEARFGYRTQGGRATPVFNSVTGKVEIQTEGNAFVPKEMRNIVKSINNSLDAISVLSAHTDGSRGFNDMQTRQIIADTAGIVTAGERIKLPQAQAPEAAPEQLEIPAPTKFNSKEELIAELVRLGQAGNTKAIESLVRNLSAPTLQPTSFSDPELKTKINNTAETVGIDPVLFSRLVKQESGGNHAAVSPVGAQGLTQLMPATAEGLGVDPSDPDENLLGGAMYLKQQIDRFKDVRKALAAYNWGPGNVSKAIKKYGDQWDQHLPAETENYINSIAPVQ